MYIKEKYFKETEPEQMWETIEKALDKSLVIHHIQQGDTIRVRYLSVEQPYEGAEEVEANLEDAYLCLLKNMN